MQRYRTHKSHHLQVLKLCATTRQMAKVTALWSSALHELEHQYSHPSDDNSKQKVAACAVLGKLAIKGRSLPAKGLHKLLTDLDVSQHPPP